MTKRNMLPLSRSYVMADSLCAGHDLLRSSQDGCITEEDGGYHKLRQSLIARDTKPFLANSSGASSPRQMPSRVLFTSGSTGESKAILATARGALCRCHGVHSRRWYQKYLSAVELVSRGLSGLRGSSTEIFGPMLHGESLVVWDGVASNRNRDLDIRVDGKRPVGGHNSGGICTCRGNLCCI